MIKLAFTILLVVILASLGSALFALLRNRDDSGERLLKALTLRIALSILAFLLLIGGYFAGLIQPHGLGM